MVLLCLFDTGCTHPFPAINKCQTKRNCKSKTQHVIATLALMKRKQEALKVLQLAEVGVSDQQTHLREALLTADAETKELIKVQDYLKQVGF